MAAFLHRLRHLLKRLASENDQTESEPHVGAKAPDESGFGGATGAEERGERDRPPRPAEPGAPDEEDRLPGGARH